MIDISRGYKGRRAVWEGLQLVVNPIQFMNTCCKKLSDKKMNFPSLNFLLVSLIQ